MGLLNKFFNMTGKPEGFLGKIMVMGMNGSSHTALADWGFAHVMVKKDWTALDCGCGGGANVERLLKLTDGHVTGLDYSEISVEQSRKKNISEIHKGRCDIIQGNVAKLPFSDHSFDLITAFETIYFWPGLESCFKEIFRVMKDGGVFMITNECAGHKEANKKWESIVDGMTIYTGKQIESALLLAGFQKIQIDENVEKDLICVLASKG